MSCRGEERLYFAHGQRVADPWATLGLERGASEAAVLARYREQVRAHPPEREPEAFRALDEAKRALVGPDRLAHRLAGGVAPLGEATIADLLGEEAAAGPAAGPDLDDELFVYALIHALPWD